MSAEQSVRIEGVTATDGVLPTSYQYVAVPPPAGNILSGSVLDDSAIISIPANRVWFGFIAVAAAQTGAGSSTITVNTTGTGQTPASTTNLASLSLVTTTAVDAANSAYTTPFIHVYGGPSGTTLDVSIDGSATVSIEAYGYLD